MSISLAAKIAGGTSVGVVGTASTYYSVQHFTKVALNTVEQKLFSNNPAITWEVEEAKQSENKSKVSVTVKAKTGLAAGESWECIISSILDKDKVGKFDASKEGLRTQLSSKLTPADSTDVSKNKKGFIWSCAGNRQSKFSDLAVKSEIFVNSENSESDKFKFGQPTLDSLFKFEETEQTQG